MIITLKIKRAALVFILILGLLFSVKYYKYKMNLKYLEMVYNNHILIEEINSFLSLNFEIKGQILSEKNLVRYLQIIDNLIFTKPINYTLIINNLDNKILLYTYGYSKKDNNGK